MLMFTKTVAGGTQRTLYEATEVGDELPVHIHDRLELTHETLIVRGVIEVLGARPCVAKPGDRFAWAVGEAHGFRALEADSHFLNTRPTKSEDKSWPRTARLRA